MVNHEVSIYNGNSTIDSPSGVVHLMDTTILLLLSITSLDDLVRCFIKSFGKLDSFFHQIRFFNTICLFILVKLDGRAVNNGFNEGSMLLYCNRL